MDIVRDGELEATNYFFSLGDAENVLELTYNHDGRTYELGTGYGHIALGVDDLDGTLARLGEQGIEPERPPTRCARRLPDLLRPRSGRLPDRADRALTRGRQPLSAILHARSSRCSRSRRGRRTHCDDRAGAAALIERQWRDASARRRGS